MSDNAQRTPEECLRHLREGGRSTLIDLHSNELIENKPQWLDEERFARAKAAVQKFFIGVAYSSYTGLLLILQLPDGLEPLLSTGNSKDIPSLYRRYLSTIVHVNSWYDDDIFDPSTKGYKSIRQVRAMHKRVQSIMNERFKVKGVEGAQRIWMSQYDMAMTQFAFIGLAMLFPSKSGMIAASEEELELVNYYWRVLGYLMGIKDEYNACQFDSYKDIRAYMELMFEREYKENYKQLPCQKGLEMTQSICVALHYFTPLITFNNLAHWWQDCFLFNGYKPQPQTTRERLLHYWTQVSFNHLLKSEAFLNFSNKLHRRRFEQRLKNKDKVYEKLCAQYKDSDQFTYYSDRVDYFNKTTNEEEQAGPAPVATVAPVECNNNTDESVPSKEPIVATGGVCPFGYGSNGVSKTAEHAVPVLA